METVALGCSCTGGHYDDSGLESLQFREEIQRLITAPSENTSSFTALLELPPTQAMELLHSQDSDGVATVASIPEDSIQHQIKELKPYPFHNFNDNLAFPTNVSLIERAAKYSAFAGGSSPIMEEASSVPSNSSEILEKVKNEQTETDSNPNLPQLLGSNRTAQNKNQRATKRKEREKKVKGSTKKNKSVADQSYGDAEKLPYVHVRARRGQATDSHSLAERARREKINARMKLLQELVPGCNKEDVYNVGDNTENFEGKASCDMILEVVMNVVSHFNLSVNKKDQSCCSQSHGDRKNRNGQISGTALVLDEIINHVQSLQRQVEFLSMKLAAVNPRIDFNLDSLLDTDSPLLVDGNFTTMVPPAIWSDLSVRGTRQQCQPHWHFDMLHQPLWGREEENRNFITSENSLLSYGSSANSASLHSNQLKMEL